MPTKPLRVLGYVRRSTDKNQAICIAEQTAQLRTAADLLCWELTIRDEDVVSGKSSDDRPVLAAALADLRAGRADALAGAKLERLARDVEDFARLLKTSEREGWAVVCLDLGVDTSTAMGRLLAHVTAAFAEAERRRIGERIRGAWHASEPRPASTWADRPASLPRSRPASSPCTTTASRPSAIARLFNEEHVPKGEGSSPLWNHSQVMAAVRRELTRRGLRSEHQPPEGHRTSDQSGSQCRG